jgi:hypothetical protein
MTRISAVLRGSALTIAALLLVDILMPEQRVYALVNPLVEITPGAGQAAVTPRAGDPGVRRSRLVQVNVNALPVPPADAFSARPAAPVRQPVLTLELFPDVFVAATFDRFDPNPTGVTWVGKVAGDARSSVTLVYGQGQLTASLLTATGTYTIRPAGDGVHVIAEVDQALLAREAEPLPVTYSTAELEAASDVIMGDTAGVIDVMVVYTPIARTHAGGQNAIEQLIATAVSETNTSYANSQITQRIRLVHTALVEYTEVSEFGTSLAALRAGTGAGLEGVAALRNQYAADLVMMLIHPTSPSACGIAYVQNTVSSAFAPSGYSVTDTSCMSPGFTFAHELGHNMGAHHDWYVSSSQFPYPYAHGYVNPNVGHRWRSIMAYNDRCSVAGFSCRRLLAWANPEQSINPYCEFGSGFVCNQSLWYVPGVRMGVPPGTKANCQTGQLNSIECDADDRRALNNTAMTVANFRQSVTSQAARRH